MKTFDVNSTFEKFLFNKNLLKAVQEIGYTNPTPIQNAVIPDILSGKDVTAKAQTGSGKTAAFCLPALHLMSSSADTKILILTPTRELALQICNEIKKFCKYLDMIPNAIYGGEPMSKQLRQLKKDDRIIVGTPGRLLDLFRSKHLKKFSPSIVALDEGDEMLKMGFFEDIQEIFSFLPKKRQTLLFSATLSPKIQKISKQFLTNPLVFDQSTKEATHKDIHQIYYTIPNNKRKSALVQTLQFHQPTKAIIFCNTKKEVDELSLDLINLGFPILSLQGDMSQKERQNSINNFRKSSNIILVATDVAGRGIDIADISHVFNYDLPYSSDCFMHRIGRTGRIGKKGVAVTLISLNQKYLVRKILLKKASEISFSPLPTKEDLKSILEKRFEEQISQESVHQDAAKILTSLQRSFQLEEISLRLISKHLQKTNFQFNDVVESPNESKPSKFKNKRRSNFHSKKYRRR